MVYSIDLQNADLIEKLNHAVYRQALKNRELIQAHIAGLAEVASLQSELDRIKKIRADQGAADSKTA